MLSPYFIPQSVFYTQSVVCSLQSVFYTDRMMLWMVNLSVADTGGKFLKKLWCCIGGSITR